VEVWLSIVSRKCRRRADFANATLATEQIEGFMSTYNTRMAHPFEYRLKDKIAARARLQLAALLKNTGNSDPAALVVHLHDAKKGRSPTSVGGRRFWMNASRR